VKGTALLSDFDLVQMFNEARKVIDSKGHRNLPAVLRYFVEEADRRRKQYMPLCVYPVLDELAKGFSTTREALLSKQREFRTPEARLCAWWLLHYKFGLSYPRLGEIFGGRDHTTILKLVARFNERLKTDAVMQTVLASVERAAWAQLERKAA